MKITKSELKEMIREALREELGKTSLKESAEQVDGFNTGDKIVATRNVHYGPAFDVFDDELDNDFAKLNAKGFITNTDDIVFKKGTKFVITSVVNSNPVLKELTTGVELDFTNLSDFALA